MGIQDAKIHSSRSINAINFIGKRSIEFFSDIGAFMVYLQDIGKQAIKAPVRWDQIFLHLEFIGNQSLNIIMLTGFFTGAVFGLQIGGIFQIFRAESIMGAATAKALTREMAPLMTAFLLAGRAGSAMTAEIATMKVNEQVDAMEAMAVDPIHYLVVPRVIASLIMIPLLCGIFIFVGLIGSFVTGIALFDVDVGIFIDRVKWLVEPNDILKGLQKAFIFSMIISTMACRYGLRASGGAKGVGQATTNSVVMTLLVVLICDVIITYIQLRL
ncbi:MAG: ABC transporter permease [Proteobacteria bacterium]|nr:ABC transporter permease [Pseudomonadota bacterium]